jgi:hypothetical protein
MSTVKRPSEFSWPPSVRRNDAGSGCELASVSAAAETVEIPGSRERWADPNREDVAKPLESDSWLAD